MFNKVIFDCDSTLTKIEGIDELAGIKGKYEEIAVLTKKAMDGHLSFEEVFSKRLQIIKPEKKDLFTVAKLYVRHCLPEAQEVIKKLQDLSIEVYLISGGYDIPVIRLAKFLNIQRTNVFSNHLIFDGQGRYKGFDNKNPLCRNDGKKRILQLISRRAGSRFAGKQKGDKVMFVGDGMNDFKVNGVVDLFVGFGGVVRRQEVEKQADVYITDLTKILKIVNDREVISKQ